MTSPLSLVIISAASSYLTYHLNHPKGTSSSFTLSTSFCTFMAEDIDVPQYFVCPISLQIMTDPVTAITGITYDRDSIEHWLFHAKNTTCPVTKQHLPKDSELTPNHTLRRLIQAWCTDNASKGVNRIPTPKPPLSKAQVVKLLKDFPDPQFQLKIVRKLELLATENEGNLKYMAEAGVAKTMLLFIVTCYKNGRVDGLEEALSVLHFVRIPPDELNHLLLENNHIMDSLTWVLSREMENQIAVNTHVMLVLKSMIQKVSSSVLETLNPEFFRNILGVLRNGAVTQQGINAALQVMLDTCRCGSNRIKLVESGAVYELVELELGGAVHEKKTTELVLGILFHLCSCAEGRAQFLGHKASILVVSDRILKGSQAADDRAVLILYLISKYSGNKMVLQEMLEFGAVKKLIMLIQVDCAPYLKEKAREILSSHSGEWKNSPCFPRSSVTGHDIY